MNISTNSLIDIVNDAGKILISHFDTREIIREKDHRDVLAAADIALHTYITAKLHKRYPGIPVFSEESHENRLPVRNATQRFILDPLDGTINFTRGIHEFGISLCLEQGDKPIIGIIYKPLLNQWFIGEKGKGATLNHIPLCVSNTRSLQKAVIAIDFSRERNDIPAYVPRLHQSVRVIRSYGCAVHALGLVASGCIDAYLYETPKLWDIAAFACIIKEAGGVILNQQGKP
jgi:myo-inositol-1(or 4)-monophosphatase